MRKGTVYCFYFAAISYDLLIKLLRSLRVVIVLVADFAASDIQISLSQNKLPACLFV